MRTQHTALIIAISAALLSSGSLLAQVNDANFEVSKVFTDDNPQEVEVTLSCFTGVPLIQSQSISQSQGVTFVVESFNDGELDCDITEEPVAGYSASYAAGEAGTDDADGCHFDNRPWDTNTSCTITNEPQPVEIYVTKDWVIDGTGGDQIDPYYTLDLLCIDGEIIGVENTEDPWGLPYRRLYDGRENGTNNVTYTALVIPHWQYGAYCTVYETGYDTSVEVDEQDCLSFNVELGDADGSVGCTITNTVFFEGIPSLNSYGMVILSLMMLGVGFVGFRRLA